LMEMRELPNEWRKPRRDGWVLGGLGVVPVSTASEGNAEAF
jgi:hypothetical protein